MKEKVLSLDLESHDFLYRIQRDSRIVYVSILHEDIVPPDCRTDSFRILAHLRAVPKWDQDWTTLTVRKGSHGIESTLNEFTPHAMDLKTFNVPLDAIYLNILDLTQVTRISDRVSQVRYGDDMWVLKIARFAHEVPALTREVSIYSLLASYHFPFAPKFIGFAYEEEARDRTVGFLMEDLSGGRTPDIKDLDACRKTVHTLHGLGIVHGDLNRHNFLMAAGDAKVFDFEAASTPAEFELLAAEEEMRSLPGKLQDESGVGRR
ncbi:hypothetical protein PRK78_007092 [Emydomyces testavorans]|uniref:Alpha-galactosidase A n=1 Tax=Emydomyces testavorans TaxID=2070801 RepID=A0AAF0IMC1_9EURO|nr:hypothetical protein PRK78_007092 [Emydomyces testavorans]